MSLFYGINSVSDIWKALVRPPRQEYREEELGPEIFIVTG